MGIEFELKYSATAAQQEAVAAQYLSEFTTFQMETTYFDTPSFALSDLHITLRRRLENGESVCTVKTPVSGYGRGEWECRCDDINASISELCKLGAPKELMFLAAEGVAPICGAKFTRRAANVEFSGAVLELALDQGLLLGAGKEIPLCEVEVELKSGDPAVAVEFAEDLARRFGLTPQKKSKFRRALALARGE